MKKAEVDDSLISGCSADIVMMTITIGKTC